MSDKEIEDDILNINEIKESKPDKKNIARKIYEFLKEKKPFLKSTPDHLSQGNFPDDMYDQQIIEFYSWLAEYSWLDDPNLSVDKNIKDLLESCSGRFGSVESLNNYFSLFSNDFIEKVRRWIIMLFEEFFLRSFQQNRTKFNSNSIKKLIDTGIKIIIGAGEPPEIWSIEEIISHFNPVIAWTEKVSLYLLYMVFAENLSPAGYDKLTHYYNLIYWLDPSVNILIETMDDDELFLVLIPKVLKKYPIPKNIFPKDLISKIKKFVIEYTPLNNELFDKSLIDLPKFKPEWGNTIYQLFLHFIYYGFVNGSIPGIKQGACDVGDLNHELDELFKFKPRFPRKEIISVKWKDQKFTARNKTLMIRYKDIEDLSEIEGIKEALELKNLHLSRNRITEINCIDSLKNLEGLFLDDNQIQEIKGLENLKNLKKLIISKNKIHELKGLENLENLETLYLSKNQIHEIKGLGNLKNLEILHLDHNKIKKLKELTNLTKLKILDLSYNQISEIKELETLVNLEMLILKNNKIREIKGLENLSQLNELDLSENQINEIKGLKNLIHLKRLEFGVNKIIEIKGLENLTQLKELYLYNNQIKEIKGLNNLNNIYYLHLSDNKILEINGLETLKKLKSLYLSGNQIKEIKGLGDLADLEDISLSNNKILEINGLEKLKQLERFKLDFNQISEIKGLENLTRLKTLRLEGNLIPEDLIEQLGGYDVTGFIKDPQKLVKYCKNKN